MFVKEDPDSKKDSEYATGLSNFDRAFPVKIFINIFKGDWFSLQINRLVTMWNMSEYGFSLILIFSYKDRIYDSLITRENEGSEKTRILGYFM